MPECTSGKLITILYLKKIFILKICLIFFVNAKLKIYNGSRCICCIPSLGLDQRSCTRKLGSFWCVFIFVCIYLALVASFCFFGIIKFLLILSMHVCAMALF
jgi:hypothetical protein